MARIRQSGMTLIELIIAIIVVSVGIAGVLTTYSVAVGKSADPMIRKQMLSIAEEMFEEISLKPYTVAANAAPAPCARNTYNDVADYNGYGATGICDIDGTALPSLAAYSVNVTITDTAISGIAAKKITIDVARGAETMQLIGWRIDWAS